MEIQYNKTGTERKALVKAISEILGCEIKYKGAPSFAYEGDYLTITKAGTLSFDDMADSKEVEKLLEGLAGRGFICEEAETHDDLIIQMPRDYFTDAALDNLRRIVDSKSGLIKKAIGADSLPIEITDENVSFPWFNPRGDAPAVRAFTHFVSALCEMAKAQQRVNASKKLVDNEKYAFRCFLLRLGFIGVEYKTERKTLLSKLNGSSAFRNPTSGGVDDE